MKQLTEKAFAAFIEHAKETIRREGLALIKEKPINYGYQLVAQFCDAKMTLSLYNGKKGLTLVYAGDSVLKSRIAAALEGKEAQTAAVAAPAGPMVTNGLWAGSDESGKGDFLAAWWWQRRWLMAQQRLSWRLQG